MGGFYPTNYKRAGHGHLGFQRGGSYSEFTERPLTAARQAASANRESLRMQELVRQTAELDRLRGPVREPRPPMPLATKPQWAQADELARMAANPHLQRAIARARALALRTAIRISPLGRIIDAMDIFTWGLEMAGFGRLEQLAPGGAAAPGYYDLAGAGYTRVFGPCAGIGGTNYYTNSSVNSCGQAWFNVPFKGATQTATFDPNGIIISRYEVDYGTQFSDTTFWSARIEKWEGWNRKHAPVWVPAVAGAPPVYGPSPDPLFAPYNQVSVGTGRDPFVPPRPPSVYTPFAPRNNKHKLERKAQTHGKGIRAIKKIVNLVTESLDVANCMYDALPDAIVGRKPIPPKKGPDGKVFYAHGGGVYKLTPPAEPAMRDPFRRTHKKIEMIARNLDEIDLNKAIECAVKNQLEDKVIGSLASAAGPFGGKYGRPIGFTSGPAL